MKLEKTIMIASHAIRHHIDEMFKVSDVKMTQGRILSLIYKGKAKTPAELSTILTVSRATITGHLDYLESLGYISRKSSSADGREIIVEITPKGQKHAEDTEKMFKKLEIEIESVLTKEENTELCAALKKLTVHFREKDNVCIGDKQ
jgi:DNA-binding MarR family transcriptional regulator